MVKKVLIMTAVAALFAVTSHAQNPREGRRAERNDEKECVYRQRAFEGIELSDKQIAKLDKIYKDRDMPNKCKRAEMRQKRLEARKESLKQIKDVLTPDQYVKYLENVVLMRTCKPGHMADAHHRPDRHHRPHGKAPLPRPMGE